MAKIVVRCQYTGNYVFTGVDAKNSSQASGGRIYCPYCAADHVWTCNEAKLDDRDRKPFVRQAS